jgi:hypothetical protein
MVFMRPNAKISGGQELEAVTRYIWARPLNLDVRHHGSPRCTFKTAMSPPPAAFAAPSAKLLANVLKS